MKAIYILLAGGLLFSACKKDSENVIEKIVTPTFPVIKLTGGAAYSVPVGGTYTDGGATAFDSINNSTSNITPLANDVNTAAIGGYSVDFLAKNAYGYKTTLSKVVIVTSLTAAQDVDISGTYERTNGQLVQITKLGRGLYSTDNLGGVPGDPTFVYPFYFGFAKQDSLVGPAQYGPKGVSAMKNPTIEFAAPDTILRYVAINASLGTSVRTFYKVH
ncbi:DUF5011 domain-containing protein [Chitinophaga polysaccharea]|uniref:immunoglobulin-like domain-containing protein n=1 Tax=Chitinophaga TaxID=79328 RepID=UPI00145502BE|nr:MULTISPECIES: immunoglobulin-like domain-containing protein [Chitinophaga]NLR61633.1 DUF5011 domain-containing protein [Chitinophaga polysaccharea]NLU93772.1 DUF5011 domain-containing protein [Chitinophaga sp. Ak27]